MERHGDNGERQEVLAGISHRGVKRPGMSAGSMHYIDRIGKTGSGDGYTGTVRMYYE